MPVNRSDVVWAYRFLLGRDPGPTDDIKRYFELDDRKILRRALMATREFQETVPRTVESAYEDAPDMDRQVVVHFHIPKCAGTSLHAALLPHFADQCCPERHNGLSNWPAGMLARYSFFSGHFDIPTLDLIPARRLSVVTMLREPRARLISMYKFLRGHTAEAVQKQRDNMGLVELARAHDAVSFFQHPELRRHTSINNGMTRALTGPLPRKRWEAWSPGYDTPLSRVDEEPARALGGAIETLGRMSAFGVQEHMDLSVRHIFEVLHLDPPKKTPERMVFDRIVKADKGLEPVPAIEMSADIAEALAPHVSLDTKLYQAALANMADRGLRI